MKGAGVGSAGQGPPIVRALGRNPLVKAVCATGPVGCWSHPQTADESLELDGRLAMLPKSTLVGHKQGGHEEAHDDDRSEQYSAGSF